MTEIPCPGLPGVGSVTIEAGRTALDRRAAATVDVRTDVATIVTLTGLRTGARVLIGEHRVTIG